MRPSGTEKDRWEEPLCDSGEYPELSFPLWRLSVGHAAFEAALTGFAAIGRSLIDERQFSRFSHTWGRLAKQEVFGYS
jgi:hypothetical protein